MVRYPRPSRGSTQIASNQTTAAPETRPGSDASHPHGTTMQPPRALPRLQRNIGYPSWPYRRAALSPRSSGACGPLAISKWSG